MCGICYSSAWVSEGKSFENMVTDECERVLGSSKMAGAGGVWRCFLFFVFVIAENTKHFYTIPYILRGFRKRAVPKSLKAKNCQI